MTTNKPNPFKSYNKFQTFALVVLIIFGLAGCSIKKPDTDPAMDKKAVSMFLAARELNAGITTSKGTGHLETNINGRRERYKMAWAAQAPNQLRLTLLVSGHPVETIVASGDRVTFISHTGKHTPHSTLSADPGFAPYIGVPIRLTQMIALLLGRLPIRDYDRAWILPHRPTVIHANKNLSSRLQELQTDNKGRITRYQILSADRALIFGVKLGKFMDKTQFIIPTVLSLYDADGRTLEIALPGIIPNAPVKESMFRLTGSGS